MRNDELTRTGLKELIEEINSIKNLSKDTLTRGRLRSLSSRLCRELGCLPFSDNLDYRTVKFACHWAVTLLPDYLKTFKKDIEACKDEEIKKMLEQLLKENTEQYNLISKLDDEING